MNFILRAESVGLVALVATAACGRLEDVTSTRVGGGYADEGGVSLDAGAPPERAPTP
ncbi:MAG: hypothetical protein ABSC94_17125 [Polyangiaceae bacterium]|jgi:hypothetical protein